MINEASYTKLIYTRARIPWMSFLFLLCVFYFVQPFDVFCSVRYLDLDSMGAVGISIPTIERGNVGRRIGLQVLMGFAVVSLAARRRLRLKTNGLLGMAMVLFL